MPLEVVLGFDNSRETVTGVQIGFENDANQAYGIQLGAANSTHELRGAQLGLINTAEGIGAQLGLMNFTDEARSVFPRDELKIQLGVYNGARNASALQVGVINFFLERTPGLQAGLVCYAEEGTYLQLGLVTSHGAGPWYRRYSPLIGFHRDTKNTQING
ncbi:MAG TPA: hypothetical protein VJB08_00430 [Candidatus Nanoarchaeia archaeon]|nr:hypothetical protein [Candidatus Nanoarchaeia archaeon]